MVSALPRVSRVTVEAPARLHMGFLDLGGSLGRKFGSIGISVDEIVTRVVLEPAHELTATGPTAERALAAAARLAAFAGRPYPAAIRIERAIPSHAGLGSGTQLALSVGVGLARLHGLPAAVRDLAPLFERGARSGIGIAAFEGGGLVVDGGRGAETLTPPLLCRLPLPPDWRFLLVLDQSGDGLHGPAEVAAFHELPAFPASTAARLCHLVLMRGLPAAAEGNLTDFGSVITELQRAVGEHFAPAQGGCFARQEVAAAIDWLGAAGAVALGQSSWGPTGFCMVETPDRAAQLAAEARRRFAEYPGLEFLVATPRGRGADIRAESLPSR